VIVLDGASLRPDGVAAVARGAEQVALDPDARARNETAREAIAALLARGEPLYGASTGVGALRDRAITPRDRERYQWNLLRSHAVTAGPPLPEEQVRAAMVVRANQLGAGGGGVATPMLDGLITALNSGYTPFARECGAIGTGDLGTLSEIALALLGEGSVRKGGRQVDAPGVCGPVTLGLRDGLSFISSNATTIGQATLVWHDARILLEAWLATAALSFEAVGADTVVLADPVQAGHGSPDQAAVARRMRELLHGYEPRPDLERPVQDPYPFRVMAQVDAVPHGALHALLQILVRELNSRCENALIEQGRAWPNGNFHGAELAGALDTLRAALAQSASLIATRVGVMLEPGFSGLPQFLAAEPGVQSGAMMIEYVAHAAASEVRSLATPVATQSVTASMGVESHGSLSGTSAKRAAEQLRAMRILVACELLLAVRALRLAGRAPSGAGTAALFKRAGAVLSPDLADRPLSGDLELARSLLAEFPPAPPALPAH